MAIGDLNGDGKPDIAAVTDGGPSVDIMIGDGAGGFHEAASVPAADFGSTNIVVTDLDGDGRSDLITGNVVDGTYLLGNGDGTFQAEQHFNSGTAPVSVAVTRFRGSSGPDLVVLDQGGTWITLVNALTAGNAASITSSHVGSFTEGQSGASYTLVVKNTGGSATSGFVTVTDTLPGGLTATGMSGAGWSCTLATLTCTRQDALAAGASYPSITLTVNVAASAGSPVINQASVSGGGLTAGSASDSTTVLAAFSDVGAADSFLPAIDLMREYGITSGCGSSPPQYCPERPGDARADGRIRGARGLRRG